MSGSSEPADDLETRLGLLEAVDADESGFGAGLWIGLLTAGVATPLALLIWAMR